MIEMKVFFCWSRSHLSYMFPQGKSGATLESRALTDCWKDWGPTCPRPGWWRASVRAWLSATSSWPWGARDWWASSCSLAGQWSPMSFTFELRNASVSAEHGGCLWLCARFPVFTYVHDYLSKTLSDKIITAGQHLSFIVSLVNEIIFKSSLCSECVF